MTFKIPYQAETRVHIVLFQDVCQDDLWDNRVRTAAEDLSILRRPQTGFCTIYYSRKGMGVALMDHDGLIPLVYRDGLIMRNS